MIIAATHVKAHRPGASVRQKRRGALDRTDSRWIAYQAPCCARPIRTALTEGERSDDDGARLHLAEFPAAKQLLAEKGDDTDWFRDALAKRTIRACIPARARARYERV